MERPYVMNEIVGSCVMWVSLRNLTHAQDLNFLVAGYVVPSGALIQLSG